MRRVFGIDVHRTSDRKPALSRIGRARPASDETGGVVAGGSAAASSPGVGAVSEGSAGVCQRALTADEISSSLSFVLTSHLHQQPADSLRAMALSRPVLFGSATAWRETGGL